MASGGAGPQSPRDQAVCGMQCIAFHITSLRFVLCVIVTFLHEVNRRNNKISFSKCLSFCLKGETDNRQRSQLHFYEG